MKIGAKLLNRRVFSSTQSFKSKDIDIQLRKDKIKKDEELMKSIGFAKTHTDHMLVIDYEFQKGWSRPQILPYGPMVIPNSASSLHYAISAYDCLNIG